MILVIVLVAGIGSSVFISTFAATAPAQPYTDIYMPGDPHYNIDYNLSIDQVTNLGSVPYFWSRQFNFAQGPSGTGAYIGLQGINKAVFSVFGESSSTSPGCNTVSSGFDGGSGPGTACLIDYTVQQGHTYRLRVWSISQDDNNKTWGAWVMDTATGQDTQIATISVPLSWGNVGTWSVVWSEYFWPLTSCSQLPYSKVTFSNFIADAGQWTAPYQHNEHIGQTDCTSGTKITDNSDNSFTQETGIASTDAVPDPTGTDPTTTDPTATDPTTTDTTTTDTTVTTDSTSTTTNPSRTRVPRTTRVIIRVAKKMPIPKPPARYREPKLKPKPQSPSRPIKTLKACSTSRNVLRVTTFGLYKCRRS